MTTLEATIPAFTLMDHAEFAATYQRLQQLKQDCDRARAEWAAASAQRSGVRVNSAARALAAGQSWESISTTTLTESGRHASVEGAYAKWVSLQEAVRLVESELEKQGDAASAALLEQHGVREEMVARLTEIYHLAKQLAEAERAEIAFREMLMAGQITFSGSVPACPIRLHFGSPADPQTRLGQWCREVLRDYPELTGIIDTEE